MLGLLDLFRRGSRTDTIRQTGCANVQMLINRTQLQKRVEQISSSGIAPASTSQQFFLRASSSFGLASAKLSFDWGDEEEDYETRLSFILPTVARKEEIWSSLARCSVLQCMGVHRSSYTGFPQRWCGRFAKSSIGLYSCQLSGPRTCHALWDN